MELIRESQDTGQTKNQEFTNKIENNEVKPSETEQTNPLRFSEQKQEGPEKKTQFEMDSVQESD